MDRATPLRTVSRVCRLEASCYLWAIRAAARVERLLDSPHKSARKSFRFRFCFRFRFRLRLLLIATFPLPLPLGLSFAIANGNSQRIAWLEGQKVAAAKWNDTRCNPIGQPDSSGIINLSQGCVTELVGFVLLGLLCSFACLLLLLLLVRLGPKRTRVRQIQSPSGNHERHKPRASQNRYKISLVCSRKPKRKLELLAPLNAEKRAPKSKPASNLATKTHEARCKHWGPHSRAGSLAHSLTRPLAG